MMGNGSLAKEINGDHSQAGCPEQYPAYLQIAWIIASILLSCHRVLSSNLMHTHMSIMMVQNICTQSYHVHLHTRCFNEYIIAPSENDTMHSCKHGPCPLWPRAITKSLAFGTELASDHQFVFCTVHSLTWIVSFFNARSTHVLEDGVSV